MRPAPALDSGARRRYTAGSHSIRGLRRVDRRRWFVLIAGSLGAWLGPARPARALEPPPDLPHYDLGIRIDPARHVVHLRERVTWTNRYARPALELVFNVYPRYHMAPDDSILLAKTVELLRQQPGIAVDTKGRAGEVTQVRLASVAAAARRGSLTSEGGPRRADASTLATYYQQKIDTALVVALPTPVAQGDSVSVALNCTLTLPN